MQRESKEEKNCTKSWRNFCFYIGKIGGKHPSRDVIISGKNLAKQMPTLITSHDVLEPLKQVFFGIM